MQCLKLERQPNKHTVCSTQASSGMRSFQHRDCEREKTVRWLTHEIWIKKLFETLEIGLPGIFLAHEIMFQTPWESTP